MSVTVALQIDTPRPELSSSSQIPAWAKAALTEVAGNVELAVRVAGEEECRKANRDYRGVDRATNVLSFGGDLPPEIAVRLDPRPIGDLLICAPVVAREASEQGKSTEAHLAHLVVHGALHLLGHDHLDPAEAERMERLEVRILRDLGYPDPYLI